MKARFAAVLAVCVLFAAGSVAAVPCSAQPVAALQEKCIVAAEATEQDIAALFDTWNQALRSGDPEKVADLYAERPLPAHAPYSAAKAALVSLTRALALELAPQVRVNAVAPGAILWPEPPPGPHGEPGQPGAAQQAILDATALGRIGAPDDIAAAVHWLLSADAGYVTGQVLHVDGGRAR